jgi:hypothetical protein
VRNFLLYLFCDQKLKLQRGNVFNGQDNRLQIDISVKFESIKSLNFREEMSSTDKTTDYKSISV